MVVVDLIRWLPADIVGPDSVRHAVAILTSLANDSRAEPFARRTLRLSCPVPCLVESGAVLAELLPQPIELSRSQRPSCSKLAVVALNGWSIENTIRQSARLNETRQYERSAVEVPIHLDALRWKWT